MNKCPHISDFLDINKNVDDLVNEAITILVKDFSLNTVYFKKRKILAKYPYQNTYSFEHILKLDEKKISDEDKKRRTLCAAQIKDIIQKVNKNECCNSLMYWKTYNKKNKSWRYKIYCSQNDILIILGEYKFDSLILITAYSVIYSGVRHDLKAEYKKVIKR